MDQNEIKRLERSELGLGLYDEIYEAAKREIVNMIKDDTERENGSPLFYFER
ncbi:MAG: hypothetical protein ABH875_05115 [Candidatus Omnitrophota bacterium]